VGQIVRHVSSTTTRFFWYPGDTLEWARAAVAVALGATVAAILTALGFDTLVAAVGGVSTAAVITGFNFGRRDADALAAMRTVTIRVAGGAAWRGTLQGVAGAGAAMLIANVPAHTFAANWLLPLVPVVLGALARQAGMLYQRAGAGYERTGHGVPPTTPRSFKASADRVPGAAL
jgi:hypothetical protein